jgi:hypothetical protein
MGPSRSVSGIPVLPAEAGTKESSRDRLGSTSMNNKGDDAAGSAGRPRTASTQTVKWVSAANRSVKLVRDERKVAAVLAAVLPKDAALCNNPEVRPVRFVSERDCSEGGVKKRPGILQEGPEDFPRG